MILDNVRILEEGGTPTVMRLEFCNASLILVAQGSSASKPADPGPTAPAYLADRKH